MDFELQIKKPSMRKSWIEGLVMGVSYFVGAHNTHIYAMRAHANSGQYRRPSSDDTVFYLRPQYQQSTLHFHRGHSGRPYWLRPHQSQVDGNRLERRLDRCSADFAAWRIGGGCRVRSRARCRWRQNLVENHWEPIETQPQEAGRMEDSGEIV